jgi:hypothetical protein
MMAIGDQLSASTAGSTTASATDGGGRWNNGHFFSNSSVNNLSGGNFHNVYNEKVDNDSENRASFNGGRGGTDARPTADQEAAVNQMHIPAVVAQTRQVLAARANPEQRAGVSYGNPALGSTAKSADSSQQHEAAGAKGEATETQVAVHPKDLPPVARPMAVYSEDAKAFAKYEQKQDQLIAKQTQEREQLQQKQDAEHQQKSYKSNSQKVEQKHQQQTQTLVQQHSFQQQALKDQQPEVRPSGGGGRR